MALVPAILIGISGGILIGISGGDPKAAAWNEPLSATLCSIHNVRFYQSLMQDIRGRGHSEQETP